MRRPLFLGLDEVIEIHADQIRRYGGRPGIRNIGLLQSALSMPSAGIGGQFLHSDLCEMAAAYVFHIVQNHPFVDGNKRTGGAAAVIFLTMNDIEFTASEEDFESQIRVVAEGKADKKVAAKFFRKHGRR